MDLAPSFHLEINTSLSFITNHAVFVHYDVVITMRFLGYQNTSTQPQSPLRRLEKVEKSLSQMLVKNGDLS